MKQQPISIITAQQKFKDWRDSKLPGAKIPKELWNIVRQILFNPKNKITVVTHGLGISTEQLRQKFPEYFDKRKKTTQSLGSHLHHKFVQAPLTALTSVMPAISNITLEHKNGTKLTLVMPTIEQFTSLIKLFTE
jgi:hypothetical protein